MTDGETPRFDRAREVPSACEEWTASSAALGQLLAALAAPAEPDEERAATRFVQVAAEAAAGASAPAAPPGARLRRRLIEAKVALAAGVAGAVLVAGVAGAATLGRLPRPVQQFAHDVLAPLGVPLPAGRVGAGDARARTEVSGAASQPASRTPPVVSDRGGPVVSAGRGAAPGSTSGGRASSGSHSASGGESSWPGPPEGFRGGRSTSRASISRPGSGVGRAGRRGIANGQPVKALSPGGTGTTQAGSPGATPPSRSTGATVPHPTTSAPTTSAPTRPARRAAGRG